MRILTRLEFQLNLDCARFDSQLDIEVFFEELAAAEKGDAFEEIYHPDALTDDFRVLLQPPTVGIADGTFFMPMQVFRELLEEWLGFMGA